MKKCTIAGGMNLLWSFLLVCLAGGLSAQYIESFDLFILDVKTGEMEQVTFLPDIKVFNPSFSNNGQQLVADGTDIYGGGIGIIDLKSGEVWGIEGGDGGNDPSWSPNGKWIVFDGLTMGVPNLFLLPPEGGVPMMIRENGIDAEWAQDSERIVFRDLATDALKTMNIYTGEEYMVSSFGFHPTWSPNGKYIAFSDKFDIYVIEVDDTGMPVDSPVKLTDDDPGVLSSQPTWANNSKSIVYHSTRGSETLDFNLWSISIKGGEPTMIGGFPESDDLDPCYSKNGQYIAFSSNSLYPADPMPGSQAVTAEYDEAMFECYPNPFSEEISIRLQVKEQTHVVLQVFDANGALVRKLADEDLSSGAHRIKWDGTNEHGSQISNGLYICHLRIGDKALTRRITMIR